MAVDVVQCCWFGRKGRGGVITPYSYRKKSMNGSSVMKSARAVQARYESVATVERRTVIVI